MPILVTQQCITPECKGHVYYNGSRKHLMGAVKPPENHAVEGIVTNVVIDPIKYLSKIRRVYLACDNMSGDGPHKNLYLIPE